MRNFALNPPQPCKEVQSLVIRANVGDKICIRFTHSLNRALSIHVQGLRYDVQTSDGASVGYNSDITTTGQILYIWYADREGVYFFQDMGDTGSSERGTNVHGLFGAVIVEAAESTWLDPETGKELESGLFADIYHPVKPAFREYAVFFHDELEIKNKDGEQPVDPHTGLPSATTAISYRSEPMRNRPPLTHEHSDSGMSSWVYGDPAPPILRAYVGDPAKIRLIHGGAKETHVFHLHNHQWRLEGDNPNSAIIDSVSISPQECYTLDILHGAGSLNRTIGDVIFHCHLYPHFHEGMWTLWRIYDRLEDGSSTLPDGTAVPPLLPLKNRVPPRKKDEMHPGYPGFIEGTYGEAPLQPPLGVLNSDGSVTREPTDLESENFVKDFHPGALLVEEAGATFHDTRTGKEINYGTRAVIKRRDGTSFRDFALFVHDFALLFDKDGNALNPPEVPGSHDDPGVMGINYRCEPMRERLKKHSDPAYVLSQALGISEAFNVHVTKQYVPGDYLYCFGGIDDAWLGLWGIVRAYSRRRKHLKPLCRTAGQILPLPPCPGKNAVIRKYEVAAIQKKICCNSHGDYDPDGLLFVPLKEAEKAMCNNYEPRPLILRANAGEWIEVTLHNLFDAKPPVRYYDYPRVPLDMPHKPSMRVSLNPQFLYYDPVCDSGVNVGFNNREQTVGPGESKKYLWYADKEYGACILQSFGDMRNHRYHGLFGTIIIEPPGAKWYRSFSLANALHEEEAVITAPGTESFRECVVMIQNGIRMLDRKGNLVQTTKSCF